MKSNNLKQKIGGAILGFSLMLGIGMLASLTAQAQYPYPQRQDDDWYNRNQRRDDRWNNRRNDRWNNNGDRRNDGYRNYGGSFDLRQTALNAGYNEGMREGQKDRQHRDRFDFRDENAYQRGTKDYNSRLGDRSIYQRYFRDAFERGYRDGYGSGYGGYGNYYPY